MARLRLGDPSPARILLWLVLSAVPFGTVWVLAWITHTLTDGSCNPVGVLRLIGRKSAAPNVCGRAVLLADLPSIGLGATTWLLLFLHCFYRHALANSRQALIESGLFDVVAVASASSAHRGEPVDRLNELPSSLRVGLRARTVACVVAAGLGWVFYLLVVHNANLFADLAHHQLPPSGVARAQFTPDALRRSWWANWNAHKLNTLVWAAVGVGPAAIGFIDQLRLEHLARILVGAGNHLDFDWRPVWDNQHLGTRPLERFVLLKEWGGVLLLGSLSLTFYLVRSPDDDFSLVNLLAIPLLALIGANWYRQRHALIALVERLRSGAVDLARRRYGQSRDDAHRLLDMSARVRGVRARRAYQLEVTRVMFLLEEARLEAEQVFALSQRPIKTMAVRFLQVTLAGVTITAAVVGAIPAIIGH